MVNPFDLPGNWYKANLHTHSTHSDGTLSPREIIRTYADFGYDVVVVSDHWAVGHPDVELIGGALSIPGIELDCGSHDQRSHAGWHIVGIGVHSTNPPKWGAGPQEFINWIREANGLVVIAHPYWLGLSHETLLSVDGYIAIEVYNGKCDWLNGKGLSAVQWDDLLQRGRIVSAIGVDDCHDPDRDLGKAWTMIKAEELSEQAIKEALAVGAFYATRGPEIHKIMLKDGVIGISCSPVERINVVCSTWMGQTVTAEPGKHLTNLTAALPPETDYVRIECIDSQGRPAWSNPIMLGG